MRVGISGKSRHDHIAHHRGTVHRIISLTEVEVILAVGHDAVRGHQIVQCVLLAGLLGLCFSALYLRLLAAAHVLGEILEIKEIVELDVVEPVVLQFREEDSFRSPFLHFRVGSRDEEPAAGLGDRGRDDALGNICRQVVCPQHLSLLVHTHQLHIIPGAHQGIDDIVNHGVLKDENILVLHFREMDVGEITVAGLQVNDADAVRLLLRRAEYDRSVCNDKVAHRSLAGVLTVRNVALACGGIEGDDHERPVFLTQHRVEHAVLNHIGIVVHSLVYQHRVGTDILHCR